MSLLGLKGDLLRQSVWCRRTKLQELGAKVANGKFLTAVTDFFFLEEVSAVTHWSAQQCFFAFHA